MIAGWLPFVTIGEIGRARRAKLVDALNDVIDALNDVIVSQRDEITALRGVVLKQKRLARDLGQIALDALDLGDAAPETREMLARLVRDLGYSVAREEEHSL